MEVFAQEAKQTRQYNQYNISDYSRYLRKGSNLLRIEVKDSKDVYKRQLFVVCNQLIEFVEDKDAILRAYPYIPRMVGCRTPEVFHLKVFREITQRVALYMIDEKIVVSIK